MVRYLTSVESITSEQLKGFFVGWPYPPSPKTHLQILRQSAFIVVAIDGSTDNVIGFIIGISDNILSVYLPLLEVLPEHQNQGIGKELVKRMLDQVSGLYMIDLTCDEKLGVFYERFAFNRTRAMSIRNYDKQRGI